MSARPRARNATPTSTSAGRKRAWRTSCAIRESIPTRSSRSFQARSAAQLHQGRRRVRLRQQMEAALLQQVGDDYFPMPGAVGRHAQDVAAYFVQQRHRLVGTALSAGQFQRPTGPLCDGCHSVNYDITTKKVTEWNVGCERCHGPGSEHVEAPGPREHRQPGEARLRAGQRRLHPMSFAGPAAEESDRRASTTTGRSAFTSARIWQISGSWRSTSSARQSFTHFPDGTAHKNRMQGNDFVQSLMYTRGVTCFSCHDVHGTENDAILCEAGQADMPRPATARTRRTARMRRRSRRTRITSRAARAASASPVTCRRSSRPSRT